MSTLREKWEEIETIRQLFPLCLSCGLSVARTPLGDVYLVDGKNRLRHRDCLAVEAEDNAA